MRELATQALWLNGVNLLPFWPLDGGMISREFLVWLAPRSGLRLSLGISLFVAGMLAVNSLGARARGEPLIPWVYTGGLYTALLFGVLALGSFQALQAESNQETPWKRWDP